MREDIASPVEQPARRERSPQRLLQLYREIGLVAIAAELNLGVEEIVAAFDQALGVDRRELAA